MAGVVQSVYIIATLTVAVGSLLADWFVAYCIKRHRLEDSAKRSVRTATALPPLLSALSMILVAIYFAAGMNGSSSCVLVLALTTSPFAIWTTAVYIITAIIVPRNIYILEREVESDASRESLPPEEPEPQGINDLPDLEEEVASGRIRRVVPRRSSMDDGQEMRELEAFVGIPASDVDVEDEMVATARTADLATDVDTQMAKREFDARVREEQMKALDRATPCVLEFDDFDAAPRTQNAGHYLERTRAYEGDEDSDDASGEGSSTAGDSTTGSTAVGSATSHLTPVTTDNQIHTRVVMLTFAAVFAHGFLVAIPHSATSSEFAEVGACTVHAVEALNLIPVMGVYMGLCFGIFSRSISMESGGIPIWVARVASFSMGLFNAVFFFAMLDRSYAEHNLDRILRTLSVFVPISMTVIWTLPYFLWHMGLVARGVFFDVKHHRHRRRRRRSQARARQAARARQDDAHVAHVARLSAAEQLEYVIRASAAASAANNGPSRSAGKRPAIPPVSWPDSVRDNMVAQHGRRREDDDGDDVHMRPPIGGGAQAPRWTDFERNQPALHFLRKYAEETHRTEIVDFLVIVCVYLPTAGDIDYTTITYVYEHYISPTGRHALKLTDGARKKVWENIQRVQNDARAGRPVAWVGAGPFEPARAEILVQAEAGVIPDFLTDQLYLDYCNDELPPAATLSIPNVDPRTNIFRVPRWFRTLRAGQVATARIRHPQ